MRCSEGRVGRVFVVRLEDGDKLPDALEEFAREKSLLRGMCILVGGIRSGGKIVVGPKEGEARPPIPTLFTLQGVHEICAVGTIFPDSDGQPQLHMHAALGRGGKASSGCIRPGIEVWTIGEIIVLEIIDNSAQRVQDPKTGFGLLEA